MRPRAIISKLDRREVRRAGRAIKGSRLQGQRWRLAGPTPANFVASFSDAPHEAGKGKYTSSPVKTDFGYHASSNWKTPAR